MSSQQLVNQLLGNYNVQDVLRVWNEIPSNDKQRLINLVAPYVRPGDVIGGVKPQTIINVYNRIPEKNKGEILSLINKYLPAQMAGNVPKYVPTSQQLSSILKIN
jgi:hypothetical protein